MRRRRKLDEEHDNHERWLVSYADFITLLFAFFVVMYSLSSVNEGKYRVLSDSLVQAFRNVNVNDSGEQIVLPKVSIAPSQPITRPAPPALDPAVEQRRQQAAQRMRNMADEIRRVLSPLTGSGQVNVTEGAFGVSVEINASLLFAPGEAALGTNAVSALQAVAQVLAPAEFPITVEGHTDNVPISTFRFPSNWELSTGRAVEVVKLLVDAGMKPEALSAGGYGEFDPVAPNDTDDNKQKNRRIEITLVPNLEEFVRLPEKAAPSTTPPAPPVKKN
jgi:chemotaxis protein MotB